MTRHILVIAPSWVGDMVMAQPMLALLKHQSDCQIDVLALSWIAPLLARMPEVDQVVDMPIGHGRLALKQRDDIGRALRGRYQQAIILPNTLKSALIPIFARIPLRTGYVGVWRYALLNDRRLLQPLTQPLLVQRYAALALPDGLEFPAALDHPMLKVSVEQVEQTLTDLALDRPQSRVIALCPGAQYGPAKRWPATHYAKLAEALLEKGHAVWLFGSEQDKIFTREINASCGGRCLDLAGRTQLEQAIDMMSLADTVVTNDSGLMHIACALGSRVVAIFGSTNPGYTPPLSDRAVIVQNKLDCSPCFKRECPLGHTHCLTELSVDQVLRKI